jgi:DNA-binding Lrp family transcriptional regulator
MSIEPHARRPLVAIDNSHCRFASAHVTVATHTPARYDRAAPKGPGRPAPLSDLRETVSSNPLITLDGTQKPGRRFQPIQELSLHPVALRAAEALPSAHVGVIAARELAGPIGIPDVTALVGNPERLRARLNADVRPLLHRVDVGVLAAASSRRALSIQTFAQRLNWPVETVARRIPNLVRAGALKRSGSGYLRHAAIQPLGRIYAIEAKVSDWRRALIQARAYGVWADAYVLVMGGLSPRAIEQLLKEVSIDGGGLMVEGVWHRRPVVHPLPAPDRIWAAEHFVSGIAHSYHPSPTP